MTSQDLQQDPNYTTPSGKPLSRQARNPHQAVDIIHADNVNIGGGSSADAEYLQLFDVIPTGGSVSTPVASFQSGQWGFSTSGGGQQDIELTDAEIASFSFVDLNNPTNSGALWTTPTDTNPWTVDNPDEIYSFTINEDGANPAVVLTLNNPIVMKRIRAVGPNTGPLIGSGFTTITNDQGETSPIGQWSEWLETEFTQPSAVYTLHFGDNNPGIGYGGVFERLYAFDTQSTGGSTIDTSNGVGALFTNDSPYQSQAQISLNGLTVGTVYTVGASFDNGFDGFHISVDSVGELTPITNAQFTASNTYEELRISQDPNTPSHMIRDVVLYSNEVTGSQCVPFLRKFTDGVPSDFELDGVTPYTVQGDERTDCPDDNAATPPVDLTNTESLLQQILTTLQNPPAQPQAAIVNTGQPVITLAAGTWNKSTITQYLNQNHYNHFVDTNAGIFASYGYNAITFIPATTMTVAVHGLSAVSRDYPVTLQANGSENQLEDVDDFELVVPAGSTVDVSMTVWLTGAAA